jgi:polyhydroxyalkanoate synthesis regulator phasin
MDRDNLLQQLLLRGLGTTSLVAERLRQVTQEWVSSGRLDPSQASTWVREINSSPSAIVTVRNDAKVP